MKHSSTYLKRTGLVPTLSIVLLLVTSFTQAQLLSKFQYLGIEGGFGALGFKVSSNLTALNQMEAAHQGGHLGLVFGSDQVRTRVTLLGAYSSAWQTKQDQQIFESSVIANLYPFATIKGLTNSRIQPYLAGGLARTKSKFYGRYLEGGKLSNINDPLLGKVSSINIRGGIGIEYRLKLDGDFINLFIEAMTGSPITQNANSVNFSQTKLKDFMAVSVGLSFGMHRMD